MKLFKRFYRYKYAYVMYIYEYAYVQHIYVHIFFQLSVSVVERSVVSLYSALII